MSHRKFEAPRHGSLAFLPRKRCRRGRGRIQAFPLDDASKACHLTGFIAFKAGSTHIVREVQRPGSKLHKKDIVEACTVLDCPDMYAVGMVGYMETPMGMRAVTCAWAEHLSDDVRRRYYKSWYHSQKKAFTKYTGEFAAEENKGRIAKILRKSCIVRLIAHSVPAKTPLHQKKAHIIELQINGGSVEDKVKFATGLFEKPISVGSVFNQGEMIDTISITKGHGWQGVIKRWGVTRLPRKTHRGLRKVACIGAWHPARVQFQVARAGQTGFHHRTQIHKKVYRIGSAADERNAGTTCDLTAKTISPMGGFPHYGPVNNDFMLMKGAIQGPRKRPIILRKSLRTPVTRKALEDIELKFIDTSSKVGHGRFQTSAEKRAFMGPTKKSRLADAARIAATTGGADDSAAVTAE